MHFGSQNSQIKKEKALFWKQSERHLYEVSLYNFYICILG